MKPITSLIKALDVLSLLSSKSTGLCMPELAEAMNLPRSTLARTLNTLIAYGLIEKTRRIYRCGAGFDQWARRDRHHHWIHRYRKVLEHVAKETGELVLLGLHEGNGIVHIDYIESDHMVRVAPAPGTRHNFEVNALGKLALSRRPDLMESIDKPDLLKELKEIQRTGVAWNREQSVAGMIALATHGFSNSPTEPMIAVAWPSSRFTEERGAVALVAIREALKQF
jgi:DNA-binding IclR family transcriptional regulator